MRLLESFAGDYKVVWRLQLISMNKFDISWYFLVILLSNYTDTCPPSQKQYKFDEPDMQDTAGEARTSS